MRKSGVLLRGFFLIGMSGLLTAATVDTTTTTTLSEVETSRRGAPEKWRIYGGFGTGYGSVSGSEYANSPNGAQYLLNADLVYQLPLWVFDAGVGWFYSGLSGRNQDNARIDIRTRSALMDLSARYRIGERWQLGPVANFAFGTDTAFGPSVSQSKLTTLLGLKAAYEFPNERFPVRLWSQVSTDVSISDRQAVVALLGIQVGIPLSFSRQEEPIHVTSSAPITVQGELRIALDPQKVFFGTDSAALKPNVHQVLTELGSYLKENPESGAVVEVSGHADQRGRYQYNLKLSKRRSDSVLKAMAAAGMDSSQVKASAHSYSIPLDPGNNKVAWAKNRRVEIRFERVTDATKLQEILSPLMAQSPETYN
jgi:outer membrane protein OmpA-like peptidoglycan-associated protein